MPDREKVIKGLECCKEAASCRDCPYPCYCEYADDWPKQLLTDALTLLKEAKSAYENGFNDAMQGKQELMYEGIDGKWYKKAW